MKEKHGLDFPVLSDEGNSWAKQMNLAYSLPEELRDVYRSFGVDLADYNGDDTWELPLAARLVVDRQGVIRGVQADADYTRRPEPGTTLRMLEEM